jgi:DNA replication initiation complex subunit (GINS family)
MTKEDKKVDVKAPIEDKKVKETPEKDIDIAEEKEPDEWTPPDENAGEEKSPDSSNPAATDEHVGEAVERDPGVAGNIGEKDPNQKENNHRNY